MYFVIGLLSTAIFFIIGRIFIVILYLFTEWFTGVFDGILWPLVGFIFMPATLLWYSAVVNWYGGHFGFTQIVILICAIIFDIWVVSD